MIILVCMRLGMMVPLNFQLITQPYSCDIYIVMHSIHISGLHWCVIYRSAVSIYEDYTDIHWYCSAEYPYIRTTLMCVISFSRVSSPSGRRGYGPSSSSSGPPVWSAWDRPGGTPRSSPTTRSSETSGWGDRIGSGRQTIDNGPERRIKGFSEIYSSALLQGVSSSIKVETRID